MKTDSTNKPHYNLDTLNSIPMSAVVGKFEELKRRGVRLVSKCVWHQDEHPSLTIYETSTENHCYCFACGQGGGPISYVMQRCGFNFLEACAWLANEFGIGIESGSAPRIKANTKPIQKADSKPIAKPVTYIPIEIVNSMVSEESSFAKCMSKLFDPNKVQYLVEEYKLGIYEYGQFYDNVVFPCIDDKGRVHNLKIQHYCTDEDSKDFFHSKKHHCYWIGTDLADKGLLPKDAVFSNECLFGAHLLPLYPSVPVVLVESPKNAILGAAVCTDCVWVAAGNKNLLKESVLKCLKGRDVMVYPDRDAIGYWKEILDAPKMRVLANFTVCDFCEKVAPPDAPKYDLADFIIEKCTYIGTR